MASDRIEEPAIDSDTVCEELPISVRAYHVLERLECKTVGDIQRLGPDVVALAKPCGKKTLKEIELAIGGWRYLGEPVDLSKATTEQLLKELLSRHGEFRRVIAR